MQIIIAIIITLATVALPSAAQTAAKPAELIAYKKAGDIPVETFFKRPQFIQMALSPDAQKLAALVPYKGRNNLVVVDLIKRTRNTITSFEKYDVANYNWINNERIFFRVANGQEVTGKYNYGGQYAINWDGSEVRDLTRIGANPNVTAADGGYTNMSPLSRTFDGTPDMIVLAAERTRNFVDVYRLNTKTAKLTLLSFETPGRTVDWVLDRNLVPRIAVREEERGDKDKPKKYNIWHRSDENSKWEKIFEGEDEDAAERMFPLAFDYDNRTLYMASNVGRDKAAIYKYDTLTKKLGDVVVEHPLIDIEGGLLFSRSKKKLIGVRYSAEKPDVAWLDADMDKLQQQVDATFPKTNNTLSSSDEDAKRFLIFSQSDVDPGSYQLFDSEKFSVEPLMSTREWLDPALMSERKFIKYTTRDGMVIPAWLTIPKGSSGKNLPLVINIHGGPQVRSYHGVQWGRPEAQFLASRGYAVLEAEPRRSTGFGRKHNVSGYKQWGLAMQDDITDGALYLVKQGIADKNRMCLFGASYGGYATLQGMVKEPDLFKCGVAVVAVSDLFLFQTVAWSDISQGTDYFETDFKRQVGDSVIDKAQFELTSPARNADKVKGPIMIAMGSDDRRVPLIHGERMRDALEKAGKKYEWVVYTGEGHGFNKDENVFDYWHRVERFLGENLK